MRLLHTSDWHLGHRLHGASRDAEHAAFLGWLRTRLVEDEVDALIIAGDVFDTANPPAEAQRAYYRFLAGCLRDCPTLDIVIIGGNHDSPARLDAAADVLRPLRIRVLGSLPRDEVGDIDAESAIVPLHDRHGAVAAWLTCVPYLRPTDWPVLPLAADRQAKTTSPTSPLAPPIDTSGTRLLEGLRTLYAELFEKARAKRQSGQALLAAAHCLLKGGAISDGSERRIQLGNSLPLPAELFPADFAYVALGHLHKAQQVALDGEGGHLRYCGSPIPLSFSERTYQHQVVLIDLDGEKLREVRPLEIPRTRQVLCIPDVGRPLDEVVKLLRELPQRATDVDDSDDLRPPPPLLEVRVRLGGETAQPLLRPIIEEALSGADAQLLRIVCERPDSQLDQVLTASETPLIDLHPEEVFARLYQRVHGDATATPPETQLRLFRQLIEQVEGQAEGRSNAPSAAGAAP